MSDHNHDHAHDHHAHDDHGHHGSDRPYFDDSTSILTPVYIIIALIVIFGTLFFS
jgi:NADH-quinone oxidoreductase subunit L